MSDPARSAEYGRATEAVRSIGGCGAVSDDGLRICIKEPDHFDVHGWDEPSPLELRMAQVLMFMPSVGKVTAGELREIVRRCARVAVEFGTHIDGSDRA